MDLTSYLDALRRDLAAAAAPGGEDVTRAAELLGGSLEASARLCLLEALSDASAEITSKLGSANLPASVEVRLRGRDAQFVVTPQSPAEADATSDPPGQQGQAGQPAGPGPTPLDDSGDVSRITLRLPEALKSAVEQAAAAEGISVNAWLVRAAVGALQTRNFPPPPPRPGRPGRRVTGFAQA